MDAQAVEAKAHPVVVDDHYSEWWSPTRKSYVDAHSGMVEAHPELIQAHSGLEQVDAGAVVHSGVIEASKGLDPKREINQKWLEQGVVLLIINVLKLPDTSGILIQSFSELL
jgi:hypothetical protein